MPTGTRPASTGGAFNKTRSTVLAERVEVAAGLWGKFLGLMGRSSLAPDTALWLEGTNGIHMFFMRFPIDCVFLDRPDAAGDRRVVGLYRRVRPWIGIVPFVRHSHGVLELPAGTIDHTGTEVRDIISLG